MLLATILMGLMTVLYSSTAPYEVAGSTIAYIVRSSRGCL